MTNHENRQSPCGEATMALRLAKRYRFARSGHAHGPWRCARRLGGAIRAARSCRDVAGAALRAVADLRRADHAVQYLRSGRAERRARELEFDLRSECDAPTPDDVHGVD